MKKIVLTALTASILVTGLACTTQNVSAISDSTTYSSNYSETEKKAIEEKRSNQVRVDYYLKYKAKGYNVDLLTPELLDSTKTTENQFWEALKQVQNNHEVPDRRAYVAKLKSYGYNVSAFTEEVIWDSGKFWELVKYVESNKKPPVTTEKKEEVKKEEYKKVEVKKEEVKAKVEEKKTEVVKKVEEKKTQVVAKISAAQTERLKTLMKSRIAKLPADSRDATLVRLETTLTKAIASAQTKNAKLLAARYEVLLAVVQEEMNSVDDETLINSLFQ